MWTEYLTNTYLGVSQEFVSATCPPQALSIENLLAKVQGNTLRNLFGWMGKQLHQNTALGCLKQVRIGISPGTLAIGFCLKMTFLGGKVIINNQLLSNKLIWFFGNIEDPNSATSPCHIELWSVAISGCLCAPGSSLVATGLSATRSQRLRYHWSWHLGRSAWHGSQNHPSWLVV